MSVEEKGADLVWVVERSGVGGQTTSAIAARHPEAWINAKRRIPVLKGFYSSASPTQLTAKVGVNLTALIVLELIKPFARRARRRK